QVPISLGRSRKRLGVPKTTPTLMVFDLVASRSSITKCTQPMKNTEGEGGGETGSSGSCCVGSALFVVDLGAIRNELKTLAEQRDTVAGSQLGTVTTVRKPSHGLQVLPADPPRVLR